MVWSGNTLVGDSVTLDPYMALGHVTTQFGRHAPAPGPHLCAHAAAAHRAGAGGVSQHAAADEADWADESLAIRCQRLPRRRAGRPPGIGRAPRPKRKRKCLAGRNAWPTAAGGSVLHALLETPYRMRGGQYRPHPFGVPT